MILQEIDNDKLLFITKNKSCEVRTATLELIEYLQEIFKRRIHLEQGYPSLHLFCVKELGFSDSEAFTRIQAMKLVHELPEVKDNLKNSELTLSSVTKAQCFFERQKKRRVPLQKEEKRTILRSLIGKSKRETEKELVSLAFELGDTSINFKDSQKQVSPQLTEIKFYADEILVTKLERLMSLLSHKPKSANLSGLISNLTDIALDKLEKDLQHTAPGPEKSKTRSLFNNQAADKKIKTKQSRYIPKTIKNLVWKRAEGKCQYKNPTTGVKCNSTYRLEFEHKIPWAKGGSHSIENLRLYCSAHNKLKAITDFGEQKILANYAKD